MMEVYSIQIKAGHNMENLIVSVNCVIPMFITLCTGLLLRRSRVVPEEMFHQLSTLSFHSLLPCLLFYNVYSADLTSAAQPRLMLFLILWTVCWFGVNFILYSLTVPDPRRRGAYIQNAFRSNIAVVGVSLAQVMLSQSGVTAMALAVSVVVPIYNVLAVIALETCRGGGIDLKKTLLGILRNPLILACLLGFLFLGLHIRLPASVERTVSSLGNAGSVTTLIALGGSFQFSGIGKNRRPLLFCTGMRLFVTPLLAVTAAFLLGFRGDALGIILICTASPMASTSYPMALACDSDHELTGQIVVASSLLCSFSLFLWIFILKQLGIL